MANVKSTKIIAALMAVTACVYSFGFSAFAAEQDMSPLPSDPEQPACSTVVDLAPVTSGDTETDVSATTADGILPSQDTETSCTAPEHTAPEKFDVTEGEVSAESEIIVGDANGDGVVNVADITAVASHIKCIKAVENIDAADVNGDGKIDVADISLLSASIKGIAPLN